MAGFCLAGHTLAFTYICHCEYLKLDFIPILFIYTIDQQPYALKQLLLQLSLSTSKIGVAVIFSNDYDNNESGLLKLSGTHRDAEKMLVTFTKLGYAVCHCKNMRRNELTDIVERIADLLSSLSCMKLVFVFSGYGAPGKRHHHYDYGEDNSAHLKLYTQDGGNMISGAKIVDLFTSFKHPKLFFFDLCQNSLLRDLEPSRLTPEILLSPGSQPKTDNILVACSILPYKELHSGSLWIELLTDKIRTESKDVTMLLNDVNNRMKKLYSSLPSFEAPQFVNKLTETVNILADSIPGNLIGEIVMIVTST